MSDIYSTEVCCVGLGPAGIGATYTLAKSHLAQHTVCLEAGGSVESKYCQILQGGDCRSEKPCQMISGIGGCSVLSGGKISGYPAGSGLASILGSANLTEQKLAETFQILRDFLPMQEFNVQIKTILAKEKFRKLGFEFRYYPVYTFNHKDLARAYKMILLQIRSKGIPVLLNTKVIDINLEKTHFKLTAIQDDHEITILTKYLILAVGHLGQNLLESLSSKINITKKEYHLDIGIRLEFPTDLYPNIDECHKDLKLLFNDARTFCVCKDGKIAPYKYEDMFLLEGYDNPMYKTGFTNFSIMIRLKPYLQNETIFKETKKRLLRFNAGMPVRQILPVYLGNKPKSSFSESSISFWQWGDVNKCFPTEISRKIRVAVNYFVSKLLPKDQWWKVSVFAPEIDFRLRFPIGSDFSVIPGLYLIGDCTGKFRGILQSFCSGVICAENLIGSEGLGKKRIG